MVTHEKSICLLFGDLADEDHEITLAATPELTGQIVLEIVFLLNVGHLPYNIPLGRFPSQNDGEALAYIVLVKVLLAEVYIVVVHFSDLIVGMHIQR